MTCGDSCVILLDERSETPTNPLRHLNQVFPQSSVFLKRESRTPDSKGKDGRLYALGCLTEHRVGGFRHNEKLITSVAGAGDIK